jgi:hypothetical protein
MAWFSEARGVFIVVLELSLDRIWFGLGFSCMQHNWVEFLMKFEVLDVCELLSS